ncbi:MAG: efflux transporter outer membrane subunit [Rhodospirillales bacterium]|nr:efflux transporter outer membrane subunit [Acetobacter sp.]
MTFKRALVPLSFLLVLAGCKVGPNYTRPTVPVAPSYSEGPPKSFDGWMPGQPKDTAVRGDWWEMFGDPGLSALEVQVATANPTVQAAEANFRQARAQVNYNRSFLFPSFGVAPGIGRNRVSGNSPTGLQGYGYADFNVPASVSWEPDLWGRIRRSITAARAQYQGSAADLANVRLELQSELAVDYFESRSLDAQKVILDNNVTAYQKALDLTTNRFNGGVASKAEVAQAQTQLNQTQAQDIDVAAARAEYDHAIAILTGRLPEGFTLPPLPLNTDPPAVPVGVPSALLQRRPDIAFQERQMAAANEQIGIARAAYFPNLVINAEGGFEAGSIVNWFTWPSRFWALGPQASQTIFDFGRRRAAEQSAQAGYDLTVANYRQATLTAFQEVEDNLSTLRILEQELAKQREATQAAQNSAQLSINRYKGGLVTYFEVITAQTIALTNERTEVDLQRRRMNATVQLIRALGGGWDRSQLPQS